MHNTAKVKLNWRFSESVPNEFENVSKTPPADGDVRQTARRVRDGVVQRLRKDNNGLWGSFY